MRIIKRKLSTAFTLIELLVVVAIISLLSSVVLSSLSGARERAQITRMVSDFKQIELGMTLWLSSTGQNSWPLDLDDYPHDNTPVQDLVDTTELGEYITDIPEPPFGSTGYHYDNDGDTHTCGVNGELAGVKITVDHVDKEIAEELNRIVDGDAQIEGNNETCGKIQWRGNFRDQLSYKLSGVQSF